LHTQLRDASIAVKPHEGGLSALADRLGLTTASLVLRRLASPTPGAEYEVAVNPAAALAAASMIKVPIGAALSRLWLEGVCGREDRVVIRETNVTANDGASPLVPGYRARLDELGWLMLTRSDNVATNTLIDVIGRGRATSFARSWGLVNTAIRRKLSGSLPLIDDSDSQGRNAHPAGDAALLFTRIAESTVPGSDWLREALAAQEFNTKLSGGLAEGDRFAHKTGDTDEVSHDGGILDLANGARFVLVVYTALPSSPENDARFARFMRALRPQLT
jgi:beta-lactamase class A